MKTKEEMEAAHDEYEGTEHSFNSITEKWTDEEVYAFCSYLDWKNEDPMAEARQLGFTAI